MDLVTVWELFKNREQYLDKKVTVGGWITAVSVIRRHSDLLW